MTYLGICPFLSIWNLVWEVCNFMIYIIHSNVGQDSSFGIVTGYWLDSQGSVLRKGRPALGTTQPTIQWVLGTISSRVKQPGHEVDHSPISCAKVNVKL
jgi:hypothetical protein